MTYHDDQRWVATVNPAVMALALELVADSSILERFWAKVDLRTIYTPDLTDECWIWTGALSSEGYGNFHLGKLEHRNVTIRAHRFSWFTRYPEPLHETLFLDHVEPVCRGRYCVNPMHLEPITNRENTLRAVGTGRHVQRINRSAHLLERDHREATRHHEMETA